MLRHISRFLSDLHDRTFAPSCAHDPGSSGYIPGLGDIRNYPPATAGPTILPGGNLHAPLVIASPGDVIGAYGMVEDAMTGVYLMYDPHYVEPHTHAGVEWAHGDLTGGIPDMWETHHARMFEASTNDFSQSHQVWHNNSSYGYDFSSGDFGGGCELGHDY